MTEDATQLQSRITREHFVHSIGVAMPLAQVFPFELSELAYGRALLRMPFRREHIRAGGTINGPAIMTLADIALYAVVMSAIGYEPLAVTSDLNARFLRKAEPATLVAEAKLLKLGRRFAVGVVEIFAEGQGEMIAHLTGTYALPSKRTPPP